eukprot:4142688-Pyramimonas_sp.AAC.1
MMRILARVVVGEQVDGGQGRRPLCRAGLCVGRSLTFLPARFHSPVRWMFLQVPAIGAGCGSGMWERKTSYILHMIYYGTTSTS